MSIKLNGATNGSVELDVPAAIGSDLSVTIPATAGELTVKATDGSVDLGAIDIAASAPADSVNIDSSGRLLVGTSGLLDTFYGTPADKLSIAGGAAPQIIGCYSANQYGPRLDLVKSRSSTVNGKTIVQNNDGLGEIYFGGTDGTNVIPAARIVAEVDGTPGANDMPGRIVLSTTADGASSPTEVMRINSLQQVAIGGAGGNRKFNVESQNNSVFLKAPSNGSCNDMVSIQCGTNAGDTTTRYINFRRQNGTIIGFVGMNGASAVNYSTSSDYRLKENVVPLTGAADRLNQLQVRRFNFIADPDTTVDGFIAHEAQAVVPECVTGTKDEVDDEGNPVYQGIDQSKLVPLLTAALQEALAEIESLKARVTALEP